MHFFPRLGKTNPRLTLIAGSLLLVLFSGTVRGTAHDTAPTSPALPAHAAVPVGAVKVLVAPDRPGWTYAVGDPAKFHVSVTADNQPLAVTKIHYKIAPDMMSAEEKTATLDADGFVWIDAGTLAEPGFLRCVATVEFDGKTHRGMATAAFSPEKIRPTQTDPEDFDAFWQAGLDELAATPAEIRKTLLPEECTDQIDVYHVSARLPGGIPWNKSFPRVYGILCVPKAPGKHPAVLDVPGAGIRAYSGMKDLAARGVITLQIGIHGIPVNLPAELYQQLYGGALLGYNTLNLDHRDAYYFRRVYLGCIRANDLLATLPEYDGKNLAVTGGSQGGQLAIVTAALDPRVKAVAARFPAYCDVTGYLHGRAGGWPHMFRPAGDGTPNRHATPEKIAVTAYYDTVNFARRLKVPVHLAWGYNDTTCPPTSYYAAHNVITAPKTLVLAVETGHHTLPEQDARVEAWLLEQLGVQ